MIKQTIERRNNHKQLNLYSKVFLDHESIQEFLGENIFVDINICIILRTTYNKKFWNDPFLLPKFKPFFLAHSVAGSTKHSRFRVGLQN